MTLEIIPPGLSTDESTKPAASENKFDRQEFFPSSLTDGQSEQFRLLGAYGTGHAAVYWRFPVEQMKDGELRFAGFRYTEAYPGAQPEGIARAVDWSNPSRPKLDDEFVKPKKALIWMAYSLERQRPELLVLEQRGLREGITEALQDGDYTFTDDAVAEFVLKISRRGTGLNTAYSCMPKPAKVTKAELDAMAEVKGLQVSCLLDGGHPFLQPAAEFKSEATEEGEF